MTPGSPDPIDGASDSRRIGILTTDTELVVKSWDAVLERMTGIPAAQARGRALDEIVPGLGTRPVLALLREPLISGSAQVLAPALHRFLIPCAPLDASGEFDRMQQRVVVGALRDEDRVVGLVITIEDVTGRLAQERQLARELRAADPVDRLAAVERLARITPIDGVGPLGQAIGDEDWQVRRAAVRAIAAREDASLVDAVVTALRDGHRNFSLLSSALQLLTLTGVDLTDALIALVRDPDPDLRVQAALALGTQRRPEASTALIFALDDPDANVRFHAIEALGRLAPPAAIERLLEVADSRDFFLAFPAVEALVRINDPLVAPRLATLLLDPMLANTVADALGQIGDEDAVAPLVDALGTPAASVTSLIDALIGIHRRYQVLFNGAPAIEDLVRRRMRPAAVSRLLDAIPATTGAQLRNVIVVVGWLREASVPAALARLLGSGEVNHEVVEALVRFGGPAVDLLVEQLGGEGHETRRAAVVALGRIGDRRATPALLALLDDDDRDLRVVVATALARLGDERAFVPLLPLLRDRDAAVRQAAVGALNSIGHPEMDRRIRVLLDDAEPHARGSAVKIAGYFGYDGCVDRVLSLCHDADEGVRCAALEHLPYFDDGRAIEVLGEALSSETPRVRAAAAQALGAMTEAAAEPLLQRAVSDSEPWVRYFAALSMGRHRRPSAIAALSQAARADAAPQVRVAAIESLSAIGGTEAARVLTPIAAAEDGDAGHAAVRALGRLHVPDARQALDVALRSADPRRRLAAVEALAAKPGADGVEQLRWAAAGDADREVAAAALAGLAVVANRAVPESRGAVDALVGCIADAQTRADAVSVLARLGPSCIPWIAEHLAADDPDTRRGVVETLGRMSHPAASACLQRALGDSDAVTRRQAVAALSRLGTRGLTRRLSTMAKDDPSSTVRQAAAAALRRQSVDAGGANA